MHLAVVLLRLPIEHHGIGYRKTGATGLIKNNVNVLSALNATRTYFKTVFAVNELVWDSYDRAVLLRVWVDLPVKV